MARVNKQRRMDELQARRGFSTVFAITPHDTNDTTAVTEQIYVGGTGNITFTPADGGADVLLSAIPVGTQLPIKTTRVKATGTTATLLVGFA